MKRMGDRSGRVYLLSLITFCVASTLYGQATRVAQGITGVVEDQSGALVPQARVVARNVDTHVETATITNLSGYFSFPGLPVDTYNLTVSASGFKSSITIRTHDCTLGKALCN